MKLRFKHQKFQEDATNAVCDVFVGQPNESRKFLLDQGESTSTARSLFGDTKTGWEYVEGVELTEEYIPIAEARIKHWTNIKEEKSNQMELI